MKINANYDLGITANLLLVEDFKQCNGISTITAQAHGLASDSETHNKRINIRDNLGDFRNGYTVTLVEGAKSCDKKIANITGVPLYDSAGTYSYHVKFEGEDGALADMDKPVMYRTTVVIKDGVAYGPCKCETAYMGLPVTWQGEVNITSYPATLDTSAANEANFDLSGDCSLTADGFFTLS